MTGVFDKTTTGGTEESRVFTRGTDKEGFRFLDTAVGLRIGRASGGLVARGERTGDFGVTTLGAGFLEVAALAKTGFLDSATTAEAGEKTEVAVEAEEDAEEAEKTEEAEGIVA